MIRFIINVLLLVLSLCFTIPALASNMQLMVGESKAIPLQVGSCITQAYQTGNLLVQADATAVGNYQNHPVAVFVHKSNPFHKPVDSKSEFQAVEIWFMPISEESIDQTSLEIIAKITQELSTWEKAKGIETMQKYELKDGMSQETINSLMAGQSKAFDLLEEEKKAREIIRFKAFGEVSVIGDEIKFTSDDSGLRQLSKKTISGLEELKGKTTLSVNCGE